MENEVGWCGGVSMCAAHLDPTDTSEFDGRVEWDKRTGLDVKSILYPEKPRSSK